MKRANNKNDQTAANVGPTTVEAAGNPPQSVFQPTKRQRREYQKVALVAVRKVRQIGLYWARRCRKSTTLGDLGFDTISSAPGKMVIGASASLLLGRELVPVTLSAAEQAMIVSNEAAAVREVFEAGAAESLQSATPLNFQVADSGKDKILKGLTHDDFANLYHSSRMELRLYFDNTHYSRLQVIAPNPATARSWRATVLRDECGYTPAAFEQALRDATDPMMRDTTDLKIVYASNLSTDDRHPWFETTMPREIKAETEDAEFPANPAGHLYYGQSGILIHRVALKDAYAAGHMLYDDFSQPMSYEQCRTFPQFKSGWDATYALNHKAGGAAVIDLIALINAQRRGHNQCAFVYVDGDQDFRSALSQLRANVKGGICGIGFDVATTTGDTSNPSSVTITEKISAEKFQRLVVLWKERKPAVVLERLKQIVRLLRDTGCSPRRLCIDATSERYFAELTTDEMRSLVPVQMIVSSIAVEPLPKGYNPREGNVNYKTYLGDLYAASVNDGRTVLPPDDSQYFKTDHRLVLKDGGRFVCTPEPDGKHGDTFDSGKLANFALEGTGPFSHESVGSRSETSGVSRREKGLLG